MRFVFCSSTSNFSKFSHIKTCLGNNPLNFEFCYGSEGLCDRLHHTCYLVDSHSHLIRETPYGNLSCGIKQIK